MRALPPAFGLLFLACSFALLLFFLPDATQASAIERSDESPILNRQKRTFGWGWLTPHNQDWSRFHQTWRFPGGNFPSLDFIGDEDYANLKRRIEILELGQKRIVAFLRKLQADRNANPCLPTTEPNLIAEPTPTVTTTTIDALRGQQPATTNPPTTPQAPPTTTTTTTTTSTTTTTTPPPPPTTTSIIIEEASTLAEEVPTTPPQPDSNDIVIIPENA